MNALAAFFAWQSDEGLLLYGTYDVSLVVLSFLVAIFASSMAMHAASQSRHVSNKLTRLAILLAGSLSFGVGVWAMHFIGMLAFALCMPVRYDVSITVASILPSLFASGVALAILSKERLNWRQLVVCGVLMGAGIGVMHYSGMAAMRMSATLKYDLWTFAASVLFAVLLAIMALSIRFGMRSLFVRWPAWLINVVSGTVMGVAITGMHYIGMAAARFVGEAETATPMMHMDAIPLALGLTVMTVMAAALVAAAGGLAQYRHVIALLRRKEQKLQAILATAMDGVVVLDEQAKIVKVNPASARMHGWHVDELLGQSVSLLVASPMKKLVQNDLPTFMAQLNEVIDTELMSQCERRDGSTFPVRLVVGKTVVEGKTLYVTYVTDYSERVAMVQALRASETQSRTLIANIPGISYRCKPAQNWEMTFISDAVERITGIAPASFMGVQPEVRFAKLMHPDDVDKVVAQIDSAMSGEGHFIAEFRLRHRDGSWRWMWGNGTLVRDEQGEVQFVDGVLLDMTDRHQMELDLIDAKEKAEAAALARSNFLANMSHEIRTPMNAIIGFTEVVLNSDDLPEQHQKHLETVRRSARSLLYLLNDILDSAKLERGVLDLEVIDFNLRELLAQVCAEQFMQADRKGLILTHEVDEDVAPFLKGDPHRLRQVLVNLIGNAVKFTEVGGVRVKVARQDQLLHVSVQDTGIGIAADRLSQIFDPFMQADASMSRRFGGTGLGTTISKQLVELMGGRIWVESTLGEGSTFYVQIPMVVGQGALVSCRHGDELLNLPPLRILAVDDVIANTELLTLVLGRLGHTVVCATNGEEAVNRFQSEPFDIVLMDVQMPVMDGLEATQLIRAMEIAMDKPLTPILALSASVLPEDRAAALAAGMNGFASKPVDPPELMAEIARLLGYEPDARVNSVVEEVSDFIPMNPEVIDQRRALRRFGQVSKYGHALARFVSEHRRWLADPKWMEAPSDGAVCAAEAHRLKGLAANLGLIRVASVCERLEQLIHTACWSEVPQQWQTVRTVLGHDMNEIESGLAAAQTRAVPPPVKLTAAATCLPLAQLRAQVKQMVDALRRGEAPETHPTLFCELLAWRADCESVLARVQTAIDGFEFDEAADALQQLSEPLEAAI